MDIETFILAYEPALRLPSFIAIFAVVGLWELVIWLQHVMVHAVPALWRLPASTV